MNNYRIEFRYIDNPFVPMSYIPLEWTYIEADSEAKAKHEFFNRFSCMKNEMFRIEKIELDPTVPVKE